MNDASYTWRTWSIPLASSGNPRSIWHGSPWRATDPGTQGIKLRILAKGGGRLQVSTQPSGTTGLWADQPCGPLFGDMATHTETGSDIYLRQAPASPTPIGTIQVIVAAAVPCRRG